MFESVSYIDLIDIYRCLFSSVFFGGLLLEMAEKKRDGYGKRLFWATVHCCSSVSFIFLFGICRFIVLHCFLMHCLPGCGGLQRMLLFFYFYTVSMRFLSADYCTMGFLVWRWRKYTQFYFSIGSVKSVFRK